MQQRQIYRCSVDRAMPGGDVDYTNDEGMPKLESIGKFSNQNETQYIKIKSPSSIMVPQLGFSAQLTYDFLNLVIHNKGCLMVADDNFVAKVSLDQPQLLNGTRNFQHATKVLLDELRIDQVLFDKVTADRDEYREQFFKKLKHVIKELIMEEEHIHTRMKFLQFVGRFKHSSSLTYVDLYREIQNNRFQYQALDELFKELEKVEQKAAQREKLFHRFRHYPKDSCPNILLRLEELVKEMAELHRKLLLEKAPDYLHGPLNTISLEHVLLISSSDVKLFTDISSIARADIFEKLLQDLANRWIKRVEESIEVDRLDKPPQLTCVIYFSLCKGLQEVIDEITERTDHRATDLVKSSDLKWNPIEKLVWKSESILTKVLQREYYFIFRLLEHFELTYDLGRQPFQYKMQLLNSGQSSSRGVLSKVKDALAATGGIFGYHKPESNAFGIPDDFYVWLCMLDDILFHVLPSDCEFNMFDKLFEGYIQFICDSKYDQMEKLRVVTHNLSRYIAQSYRYGGRTPLDKAVLQKQLDNFSFSTNQNVDFSKNFRDQVDVFNSFWKTRNDIIDQFPAKINLPEMTSIQKRLMKIMLDVLHKDIEVDTRVAFFRTFNDFLIDLNEVSFDWYIKDISGVNMAQVINLGKVELVDNKWKETINRTYWVLDPNNFSAFIKTFTKKLDVPKHYVIEVVQTLLEHVSSQLHRTHWVSGESLSDTDQVLSINGLIIAIRKSFLYLKEQVEYVSFDQFYDERVKLFASVVETSSSLQDFLNRIHFIKESFWYFRKQNEISIEDALELYGQANRYSNHDLEILRKSYAKYSQFFEEFMQLYVDKDSIDRAHLIAQKVKAQYSKLVHFKSWDDRFKQDQVPQILAGLAAVWSILVSKDVATSGKYFNPHCMQILCVLRLLSVDEAGRGIDKHFAQVLTGQGKSLVLGLLAALFALTGHNILVACYSKYLADRDMQDFSRFYAMFDIAEGVVYGTFDELANVIITQMVDGQTFELRDLVRDLLLKEKVILPHQLITADSSNAVLLMDEVDVFFTKKFYGSTYNPVSKLVIPGLDRIQELIWKYVVAGLPDVRGRINQYIRSDNFEQQFVFLKFLERPNCYTFFENGTALKTYTNKTLFDEHLGLMIEDANFVCSQREKWKQYKLNSDGIVYFQSDGVFVSNMLDRYKNIFHYFRLKGQDFETEVNEIPNYGYLALRCGSLSYAMLPIDFPLIVGVSGTLTTLNSYEKNTIEQLYNIQKTSVMPTFFGCTNLQFNTRTNFHHHATISSWRTSIFRQANQMIAANRAVIVFFDTEVELDAFESEYAGQLDRLNVLTENTEDKERFISEAGVAKTITLATRGMGRGVDYKSSVTVEKNGGVHVIQTFFSMDVKEETQIKGRTARKDNKGSYEMIFCDEDLVSKGLIPRKGYTRCRDSFGTIVDLPISSGSDSVTYNVLNRARREISEKQYKNISMAIERSEAAHEITMDYMRSFFKK